jgi:hypothetical protein
VVRGVRGGVGWRDLAAGMAGLALGLAALLLLPLQDVPGHPMNYIENTFDVDSPLHIAWAPDAVTRLRRTVLLLSGRQYLEGGWFHPFMLTSSRLKLLGAGLVLDDLPIAGIVLAVAGLALLLARRSRDGLLALGWLAALVGWLAFGAFPNVVGSFFLPGLWVLAWCLGVSVAWTESHSRPMALVIVAVVLALPLVRLGMAAPPPALARHGTIADAWRRWPGEDPPGRPDPSSEVYARGVLATLPERAVVLSRWGEGMTLLYAQHALGLRPDVDVRITGTRPERIARGRAAAEREGRGAWATFASPPGVEGPWLLVQSWRRGGLWRCGAATP